MRPPLEGLGLTEHGAVAVRGAADKDGSTDEVALPGTPRPPDTGRIGTPDPLIDRPRAVATRAEVEAGGETLRLLRSSSVVPLPTR